MATPDEKLVRRLVSEALERALGPAPGAPSTAPAPPSPARPVSPKRVALGADHGGYALKEILRRAIADEMGWDVHDCGTHSAEAVDYPDFAAAVAREVASGRAALGIVVDTAGIGSTMAANKVAGVRCALCHDDATVLNAREHNDANVLSLAGRFTPHDELARIVRAWFAARFDSGRHARRVEKIREIENDELAHRATH